VREADDGDPLARIVRLTLQAIEVKDDPDLTISVTSTVPIARAWQRRGRIDGHRPGTVRPLWPLVLVADISDLVYQTELIYHGTPSGIDNTVVAFEKPVFFVRDVSCEIFWVGRPFLLAIADPASTARPGRR